MFVRSFSVVLLLLQEDRRVSGRPEAVRGFTVASGAFFSSQTGAAVSRFIRAPKKKLMACSRLSFEAGCQITEAGAIMQFFILSDERLVL